MNLPGMRVALLIGAIALAAPQAVAAESLLLMVGGIEKLIYLPAKLAETLGYFEAQGLQVQLLSERSGIHAADELLAGSVDGVIGFYDHTIDLQAKGKSVVSIVQLSHTPGEAMMGTAADLSAATRADEARSRTIGVTGLGSSTHFLSQFLLQRIGYKPTQLRFLPVGTGASFIASLQAGTIDVGMTTEPTVSRLLVARAARVLIDLRTPEGTIAALGGIYPGACLYVHAAWLGRHPDQARKLAAALVNALHFIQSHEAAEIARLMPRDYYGGDETAYIRAIASSKAMFTPDGRIPAAGPASVLRVLSQIDRSVQGKAIDLARTYTSDYLPAAK